MSDNTLVKKQGDQKASGQQAEMKNENINAAKSTDNINNLINFRNKLWGAILGVTIMTTIILFTLSGWFKLFLAGSGLFLVLILFILYRITNIQISKYFDELFPAK